MQRNGFMDVILGSWTKKHFFSKWWACKSKFCQIYSSFSYMLNNNGEGGLTKWGKLFLSTYRCNLTEYCHK